MTVAKLHKIVSGGQTGVDRAALDVALELGLPCGGWCPQGRRAEDGPIDPRYPLRETRAAAYPVRTRWNVRDSDGTLILTRGRPDRGTALTADLAKRLGKLPSSAERDAALTELGDIGRVSRQTLHDIREAVSGYRRPTLAIEVITARNALEAAGIALDDDAGLTLRSGNFDPDAEAVLAWCLREAVTNVIRHSHARHCRIRLAERIGEVSLEVTDDGRGFVGQDPGTPNSPGTPDVPRGSGLHGVSERLSAIGGRLSLGPAEGSGPGHGFRLIATVPAVSITGAATGGTAHNGNP